MTRPFLYRAALVCVVACLALATAARASAAAREDFVRGNACYAAGDFAGASNAYEQAVRRGDYTANLFYNLADAYYRQGNRGRAILNYQRALILDPSHAEANANLAFVRGTKAAPLTQTGWVLAVLPWLTAGAGWLAVLGLLIVVAVRRARGAGVALLTTGLLACTTGIVTIRSLDDNAANTARAVVVADNAPALYAPADNSKVVTRLTAGGEVRVLSDQGAWVYALLGDGTRAWLAADKIERVVPR